MRTLVVTENITLDGVIDMSGGWFDPLAQDVDRSEIAEVTAEHSTATDALLVGRHTFKAFREFWPAQTNDPTGVSDYLNAVQKYVVSSTLPEPGWQHSTVLRGELVDEVRALTERPARCSCAMRPTPRDQLSLGADGFEDGAGTVGGASARGEVDGGGLAGVLATEPESVVFPLTRAVTASLAACALSFARSRPRAASRFTSGFSASSVTC
jgi:hypothetical protein